MYSIIKTASAYRVPSGCPNLLLGFKGSHMMATREERAAATAAHAKALEPVIKKLAAKGITGTSRIARALNDAGHPAIRGGLWVPAQVEVLLQRLGLRE